MPLRLAGMLSLVLTTTTFFTVVARSNFTLSNLFSDAMVLQTEAPTLFGKCTVGCQIRATITGGASSSTHCGDGGDWKLVFPEQPPSDPTKPGASITAVQSCEQEQKGNTGSILSEKAVLNDLLFGDVWVCGGQSNMEFSVAEAFGYDGAVGGLIPHASRPGLRLFAVQKNASSTPLSEAADLQYSQGWVRSTPQTVCGAEYRNNGYNPPANTSAYCAPHCGPSAVVPSFSRATWGYFSAVCHATGAALLRDTGRPQGMIESCWGGTRIQPWTPATTPPDQLRQSLARPLSERLHGQEQREARVGQAGPGAVGTLYNGMIAPLRRFPIKGALWCEYRLSLTAPDSPVTVAARADVTLRISAC